jgi:hypothetical protein
MRCLPFAAQCPDRHLERKGLLRGHGRGQLGDAQAADRANDLRIRWGNGAIDPSSLPACCASARHLIANPR